MFDSFDDYLAFVSLLATCVSEAYGVEVTVSGQSGWAQVSVEDHPRVFAMAYLPHYRRETVARHFGINWRTMLPDRGWADSSLTS